MGSQSYCSPFLCDRTVLHVHPAIPALLAPELRKAAARDGLPYDEVRRRIVSLAARLVRARGRVWLETNGRRGAWVPTDLESDRTMNSLRRSSSAAAYLVSQALVSYKVVMLCEHGSSLQEVFSRLESSPSPLP